MCSDDIDIGSAIKNHPVKKSPGPNNFTYKYIVYGI